MLGHAGPTPGNVAQVVFFDCRHQDLVELGHRGHLGHRDHKAAAEAADLSFDAALFVGALDAGQAEEAVKTVVGPQGGEAVGLDPARPFRTFSTADFKLS